LFVFFQAGLALTILGLAASGCLPTAMSQTVQDDFFQREQVREAQVQINNHFR
jgi:hypothetical protein